MIRSATTNDITRIIELGKRAQTKTFTQPDIDPLIARRTLAQAVNDKSQQLLVAEHHNGEVVGFLFGAVMPYWFSKERFATDLAFYCHEQHGNYAPFLARRFIKWAKAQAKVLDVTLAITSGLDEHQRIGQLYQKLGLSPVGGVYSMITKEQP